MSHTCVLLALYLVAGLFEVLGIALTVQSVEYRDNQDGTGTITVPHGWRAALGPLVVVAGIFVGVLGNVLSLYLR